MKKRITTLELSVMLPVMALAVLMWFIPTAAAGTLSFTLVWLFLLSIGTLQLLSKCRVFGR